VLARFKRVWVYLSAAVRTHPFNFFTLVIAVLAAGFAGWSSWEAHLTRVGADHAAEAQARDVERSRKAAEESAAKAGELVAATKGLAESNSKLVAVTQNQVAVGAESFRRSMEQFHAIQRPWLEVTGPSQSDSTSILMTFGLRNRGKIPAIDIAGHCDESLDDSTNARVLKKAAVTATLSSSQIGPEERGDLYVPNIADSKDPRQAWRVVCAVSYADFMDEHKNARPHEMGFCYAFVRGSSPQNPDRVVKCVDGVHSW